MLLGHEKGREEARAAHMEGDDALGLISLTNTHHSLNCLLLQ